MTAADIVLIITAAGVLVTAVAGAVVQIITLKKVDSTKTVLQEDVQAVHKIVNQQRTDMLAYQDKLVQVLQRAGMHVPQDESVK